MDIWNVQTNNGEKNNPNKNKNNNDQNNKVFLWLVRFSQKWCFVPIGGPPDTYLLGNQ